MAQQYWGYLGLKVRTISMSQIAMYVVMKPVKILLMLT